MKKAEFISKRESGIMILLQKGMSNRIISEEVGVSVNTVKYHLKKIYKKLHAQNRVDAINKYNKLLT